MANTKYNCPECQTGYLKCTNTNSIKHIDKHPIRWSRISSWKCLECLSKFRLYTPVKQLLITNKCSCTNTSSLLVV